ncbi:type II secretion system minor pseudopilin GspK [Rhodanobacter soli]|uniref:type II secretion system minor pseudopilin GspK n=1 Tax=Rhodanobacter soli TaxID=590609 RepID=UPI0031D1482F
MNRHAHGAALLMAMAIMAFAAVAAAAMLVALSTWSRQSGLTADHVQAEELVIAGGDWTRAMLYDDRRASGEVDYPGEPWALRLPPMPFENGELAGHIDDQQGLFNLNNLVQNGKLDVVQYAHFQRLLSILGLPAALADALADWIDADGVAQPAGGAEDAYYAALGHPYLTANRPLIDLDELALVRGFDPDVRARLAPFVTALPTTTALNVNTASAEVLAAVVDGLDLDSARLLVAARSGMFYRNNADFLSQLGRNATVPESDIRVGSDYFLVTLRVTYGKTLARGQLLLARTDATHWPEVVWRKTR